MTTYQVEKDMTTFFNSLTTLTDLIGLKFEPLKVPQELELPAIAYVQQHRRGSYGLNSCVSGMWKFQYVLHVISKTESECNLIVQVLEAMFTPPYAGLFGESTVKMMYVDDVYHNPEDALRGTDIWPYHKSVVLNMTF